MAENFADLVVKTSADNRALEAGMRESEQIVEATSDQMVASLTRVTTSAGGAALGADRMSKSFAAVGAAGSLAGSQFGGMASQVAGLGGAIASLGIVINPVVLALAGIALAAVAVTRRMKEGKSATDEWSDGIVSQVEKLSDLNSQLRLLRGFASEAEVAADKAFQAANKLETEDRALFRERAGTIFNREQEILRIKKEQADVAKTVADFRAREAIAAAGIEASEKKREQTLRGLRDQIAIAGGADPLNLLDVGIREKTLRLELRITQEKKAQQVLEDTLARSQEAKNRALAQSLAIRAGIFKPSDFATDATERRLLEIQELLGGNAAASGGTQAGGGFSIGGRAASEFRFGGATGGAEFIGAQQEQVKQTKLLTSNVAAVEAIRDFLTLNPTLLGTETPQGLGFGGAFP